LRVAESATAFSGRKGIEANNPLAVRTHKLVADDQGELEGGEKVPSDVHRFRAYRLLCAAEIEGAERASLSQLEAK
jgi:hypothetical protein